MKLYKETLELIGNDWVFVSDVKIMALCSPAMYDKQITESLTSACETNKALLRFYNSPYDYFNLVVVAHNNKLIKYKYYLKK